MKHQNVAATTEILIINGQRVRYSKEALDSLASHVNGTFAVAATVEHDWTIPPSGKVLSAFVQQRADGEYELVEEVEYFEKRYALQTPDGRKFIRSESELDRRPFKAKSDGNNEQTILHLDQANFPDSKNLDEYLSELREGETFDFEEIGRHSQIPDPLIFIETLPIAYFVTKVTKRVVDKLSEDTADAFVAAVKSVGGLTKKAIIGLAKRAIPKESPITIVSVPGDPNIEFVFLNNDVDLQGLEEDAISKAVREATWLDSQFSATKIQFHFLDDEWKLNYLLTKDGGVIGSEYAIARQDKRWQQYLSDMEKIRLTEVSPVICTDATEEKLRKIDSE